MDVRFFRFLSVVFLGCLYGVAMRADASEVPHEYQVKAAFLYNFARFVDWPDQAFESDDSPLIIGVFGADPFDGALNDAVKDKAIDGRPIQLIHSLSLDEVEDTHILFITELDPRRRVVLLESLRHQPVLTVSDSPVFTESGGIIRFFIRDRRVAFEINTDAADRAGLRISSRLLNVAQIHRE